MRSLAVLIGVCACGGAPPSPGPVRVAAPRSPTVPAIPHAEFVVAPAELGDPGILAKIPHRTRIRHFGSAWLREDEPDSDRARPSGNDTDVPLPVIGESRTRIRVAFEDDDARMALWIPREDTWPVLAVPFPLADASGLVDGEAGVFVARGAPLTLSERAGERRAVRVRDELLELRGFVPERLIANIWLAGADESAPSFSPMSSLSWSPPADLRTRVRFLIETKIRRAPDGKSPVIAAIEKPDVIGVIAANLGDYRLVEIVRPYARIRGYVAASEVAHTPDELHSFGTGGGHGFGMSHADRIDVPAGTCLFDRADGEVVGVQYKPTTRLGRRGRDGDKWSQIHIGTTWTIATVHIHDLGDDPDHPRWESCMPDAHHR